MTVKIYDDEDHVIHPSDNILTKTTFGKQFEVLQVDKEFIYALTYCIF